MSPHYQGRLTKQAPLQHASSGELSQYKDGPTNAAPIQSGRWGSQQPVLQSDAGGKAAWEGTKPNQTKPNQSHLWTRGPVDQGQILARARREPDVSTEPESLPPYGACEGTTNSPTEALPNDYDNSKIVFNCTRFINYE